MPDKPVIEEPTKESPQPSSPQPRRPMVRTESMDMLLAQLDSGEGIANKLTESHIDKILDQRGDIIDKVHKDRRDERWDGKFYFMGLLVFALIILGGVSYVAPEYLSEAIVALISGLGGYGYGKGSKKS